MNRLQIAEQMRVALQFFVQTLPEEQAMEVATTYPKYAAGKHYEVGYMFTDGVNSVGDPQLYKVLQSHDSQADWKPNENPALYKPIGLNEVGYPIWSQPSGREDAYMAGDVVDYNGVLKESIIDYNTWSPDAYPAGWKDYVETE